MTNTPERTPAETVDLWAIYYPGKTPEQAYHEARAENDKWYDAYLAVRAAVATFDDCETAEDRDDYWKRLASAQADLLRHDGVPDQWIDERGSEITPDDICRECWQPGATDVDRCDGCAHHYHAACCRAMSIRCDLRCAAYARINGEQDRAAMWERAALDKHLAGGAS